MFFKHPSSSSCKAIIVLKKIFSYNTCFYNCWFTMATAYLISLQLNYFDSMIITGIKQLKRWKKRSNLDNIYKEVIKSLNFVSVEIQYLSSRLLALVQEGKANSKLHKNTVLYIADQFLHATNKSLTGTPKT